MICFETMTIVTKIMMISIYVGLLEKLVLFSNVQQIMQYYHKRI